ncbi:hypothetical protein J5893_02995 [bacterium]|nr:hypothetical protein [bacterium]
MEATLSSEVIGPSHLFSETKLTDPEPILENVLPERMHDHAIEAGAVF